MTIPSRVYKDEGLDRLANRGNVAQFASFSPDLEARYSRVRGFPNNHVFASPSEAARALLAGSATESVNVRSFLPSQPRANEFIYGIVEAEKAASEVQRLGSTGLYSIINETIDVDDGGVSGVLHGDLLEFSPGDTPRAVEKPGVASLPSAVGRGLLETVYGFEVELAFAPQQRVEFSIHPLRAGHSLGHTILWEIEEADQPLSNRSISWPNNFSRFIGDKAFGLLLAAHAGLPVPRTTVISRRCAPFTFGARTGSGDTWIRTVPAEPVPGRFVTQRGWTDPFVLMNADDPTGLRLAAVLAQDGVSAEFSGAALVTGAGETVIEGVRGFGDDFMLGKAGPEEIPSHVVKSVNALADAAMESLSTVHMEWAHDGDRAWVLQLHQGDVASSRCEIYSGGTSTEVRFSVKDGLEALRSLVAGIGPDVGVVLVGDVGLTSHFGDVLRKARIPSRIEKVVAVSRPVG
jgi:hypothetical protein